MLGGARDAGGGAHGVGDEPGQGAVIDRGGGVDPLQPDPRGAGVGDRSDQLGPVRGDRRLVTGFHHQERAGGAGS